MLQTSQRSDHSYHLNSKSLLKVFQAWWQRIGTQLLCPSPFFESSLLPNDEVTHLTCSDDAILFNERTWLTLSLCLMDATFFHTRRYVNLGSLYSPLGNHLTPSCKSSTECGVSSLRPSHHFWSCHIYARNVVLVWTNFVWAQPQWCECQVQPSRIKRKAVRSSMIVWLSYYVLQGLCPAECIHDRTTH